MLSCHLASAIEQVSVAGIAAAIKWYMYSPPLWKNPLTTSNTKQNGQIRKNTVTTGQSNPTASVTNTSGQQQQQAAARAVLQLDNNANESAERGQGKVMESSRMSSLPPDPAK